MPRHLVKVVLATALCGLLLAPVAGAAKAPAPRTALVTALHDVQGLASQAASRADRSSIRDAARTLGDATIPPLWINAYDSDGPSYGTRVFTDSLRAVRDLQRLASSALGGSAIALIVGADRSLAEGVMAQARGGSHRLLRDARRAVASGDQAAATGDPASAASAYTKGWSAAFRALTKLVTAQISRVPFSALSAAAENALGSKRIGLSRPMIVSGQPPLTLAGKPEVFYAGSEACPFCGVERWGMILALSQFGTFSNLHLMQSSPAESPEVRTFTFFGSSYASPYLSFVPVEVISNVPIKSGFARRQRLTTSENRLVNQYDPPGTVPFIDIANRFITVHSTVFPRLIKRLSWTQLTGSLRRPRSVAAQAIAGEAEVLTAEMCEATGGQPAAVCSTAVVHHYEDALPRLNGRGGGCPTTATSTASFRRQPGPPPQAAVARCHY
jgi:Domain of unknown function (DUF929)